MEYEANSVACFHVIPKSSTKRRRMLEKSSVCAKSSLLSEGSTKSFQYDLGKAHSTNLSANFLLTVFKAPFIIAIYPIISQPLLNPLSLRNVLNQYILF